MSAEERKNTLERAQSVSNITDRLERLGSTERQATLEAVTELAQLGQALVRAEAETRQQMNRLGEDQVEEFSNLERQQQAMLELRDAIDTAILARCNMLLTNVENALDESNQDTFTPALAENMFRTLYEISGILTKEYPDLKIPQSYIDRYIKLNMRLARYRQNPARVEDEAIPEDKSRQIEELLLGLTELEDLTEYNNFDPTEGITINDVDYVDAYEAVTAVIDQLRDLQGADFDREAMNQRRQRLFDTYTEIVDGLDPDRVAKRNKEKPETPQQTLNRLRESLNRFEERLRDDTFNTGVGEYVDNGVTHQTAFAFFLRLVNEIEEFDAQVSGGDAEIDRQAHYLADRADRLRTAVRQRYKERRTAEERQAIDDRLEANIQRFETVIQRQGFDPEAPIVLPATGDAQGAGLRFANAEVALATLLQMIEERLTHPLDIPTADRLDDFRQRAEVLRQQLEAMRVQEEQEVEEDEEPEAENEPAQEEVTAIEDETLHPDRVLYNELLDHFNRLNAQITAVLHRIKSNGLNPLPQDLRDEIEAVFDYYDANIEANIVPVQTSHELTMYERDQIAANRTSIEARLRRLEKNRTTAEAPKQQKNQEAPNQRVVELHEAVVDIRANIATLDPRELYQRTITTGTGQVIEGTPTEYLEYLVGVLDPNTHREIINEARDLIQQLRERATRLNETDHQNWLDEIEQQTWVTELRRIINIDVATIRTMFGYVRLHDHLTNALANFNRDQAALPTTPIDLTPRTQRQRDFIEGLRTALTQQRVALETRRQGLWTGEVNQRTWMRNIDAIRTLNVAALPENQIQTTLDAARLILNDYDLGVGALAGTDLEPVTQAERNLLSDERRIITDRIAELEARLKKVKEEAEKNTWETGVKPLVITIEEIEQLDARKVRPGNREADAKDTAQLEPYKQNLETEYANVVAAGLLIDLPNPLIMVVMDRLVGRTKTDGRYGQAVVKIDGMIAKSKESIDLRKIKPSDMTLDELVRARASIFTERSPWAQEVIDAFIKRKGEEKDPYKYSRNHILGSMPSVILAGDSEKPDWAADYNKVIDPLISSGITLENLLVYIFMHPDDPNRPVSRDDINQGRLPIETRAIDMWDYIVARIRDKWDGITEAVVLDAGVYRDNTNGLIIQRPGESDADYQTRLQMIYEIDQRQRQTRADPNERFSYSGLNGEDSCKNFEDQLKLIFAGEGDMSEEKVNILINFYKHYAAKSAGYMPWLMRATTRGHGFSTSNKEPKNDESRFLNSFALNAYNALRYRYLKLGRFMSVFIFVPKNKFVQLVSESSKGEKAHSAALAWDVMNDFRRAKWEGNIPQWMTDARKLFDGPDPEIKIDGTIYPPLPELLRNIAEVEQEKRDLLQAYRNPAYDPAVAGSLQYDLSIRINGKTFAEATDEFVKKYDRRGYAAAGFKDTDPPEIKLAAFGIRKIIELKTDPTHLALAEAAMEKMFKFFEEPMPVLKHDHHTNQHQAVKKFEEWCSAIVGKAKLIPGDHQMLFVPLTCDVIVSLCQGSEHANNKMEVDKIFSELMTELNGAGGVPSYVRREVFKAFGVTDDGHGHLRIPAAPRYCVNYENLLGKLRYNRELWLFRNEHTQGFFPALGRLIPVWGMFDTFGGPYEEAVKKTTDTTSSGT